MIGKILGTGVRIINLPAEALERLFEPGMKAPKDEDRVASLPLETLARACDDIDKPRRK